MLWAICVTKESAKMTTVTNKNGIEFDIDDIATDLNGKADVDLTNVNDSGTSKGAGWAMPSDTYENLTVGSAGTSYTAPANGYAVAQASIGSDGYIILTNGKIVSISQHVGGNAVYIPVRKGQSFVLNYLGVSTWTKFIFVYASGSESEA